MYREENVSERLDEEYTGYIMSGYHGHVSATEYICVDKKDTKIGHGTKLIGRLLYMVEAKCGSLPGPPYVEGREVTCIPNKRLINLSF